jgi:hypothetical protein
MNLRHRGTSLPVRLSLCAAAVLALGACGDKGAAPAADHDPTPSPAPSAPTPTSSAAPASDEEPARVIAYAGGESPGIEVHERADARLLHGAPASFRRFIGRTAQRLHDESTCTGGDVGVTVATLRTDGYAVGGVDDCGGYRALWATVDGRWQEVAGTQELWDCAVLERYEVPSDVVETRCYDYDAQEERAYHQA